MQSLSRWISDASSHSESDAPGNHLSPTTPLNPASISRTLQSRRQSSSSTITEQGKIPSTNIFRATGLPVAVSSDGGEDQGYQSTEDLQCDEAMTQEAQHAEIQGPNDFEAVVPSVEAAGTEVQPMVANPRRDDHTSINLHGTTTLDKLRCHGPNEDINLIAQSQPSDTVPTTQRRVPADRSSAPPEPLGSLHNEESVQKFKYLDCFSTDILPPPTASVFLQIITFIQRWAIWVAVLDDKQQRERLIGVVADKMENVWLEALRSGLFAHSVQTHGEVAVNNTTGSDQGGGQVSQGTLSAQQLTTDILSAAGRGLRLRPQQRKKRLISPSRDVVLKPRAEKRFKYGITVGELREAGVTLDLFRERVLSVSLDKGDELVDEVLEQLGKNTLDSPDWYMAVPETAYNLLGRDLMIYCLWEVQNCIAEMETLEYLKHRFNTNAQIRNTQARMDAEKQLHDQYLALALILHEKDTQSSSCKASCVESATVGQENTAATSEEFVKANPAIGIKHRSIVESTPERPLNAEKGDEGSKTEEYSDDMISQDQLVAENNEKITGQTNRRISSLKEGDGSCGTTLPDAVYEDSKDNQALDFNDTIASQAERKLTVFEHLVNDDSIPNWNAASSESSRLPDGRFALNEAAGSQALVQAAASLRPDEHRLQGIRPITSYISSDFGQEHDEASNPLKPSAKRSSSLSSIPSPRIIPKIKLSVHKRDLKVVLKTRKKFNPRDYSACIVNNTRGFRWRYLKSTTIDERDSMDNFISAYVGDRIDFDREKKKRDGGIRSGMPDRFGTYEVLAHPHNAEKSIVHGIWDNKNKSRVQAATWFYEGKDGEWVYPIKSYDFWGHLITENQLELNFQAGADANRPKQSSAATELDGAVDDANFSHGIGMKGKGGMNRSKVRSMLAFSPLPSSTRGTKRGAEPLETERPKRRAARAARKYALDDEDSDDEWVP